ncbi:MAG: hypothetical protein CL910_06570 [Deltaproteobacteria bacterium]|jgi:ABC-type transport system involved in multi-copper enzyme maturation permease subunit|nr:hypothetical protein [Deltaproteobacteria bacterium]
MTDPLDFGRTVARLVRADVTKLSHYWVVLIGFCAIFVLAVPGTMLFHWAEQAANVASNSGYDFALSVVNRLVDAATPIVYVLICILFAIDVSNSTLKCILTRPVTRMELLCSKYVTALGMVLLMVTMLWVVALGAGAFYHGLGDLTENDYVIFEGSYVLGQFAIGTGFVLLCLSAVAALGVTVSTFSSTMGGAIIIGMILFFFFDMASVIPASLGFTLSLGGEPLHVPLSTLGFTNQLLVPLDLLGDLPTGIPIRTWWTPEILRMVVTCTTYFWIFFAISAVGIRRRDFTL